MIDDPFVVFAILFLAVGKFLFAGVWIVLIRLFELKTKRQVYTRAYSPGQLRDELKAAWVIPLDGVVFYFCITLGLIRLAPSHWATSVLTFIVLFVFFEIWFYTTHRLMHTRYLYRIHMQHHRSTVTGPLSGLRFSFAEKTVLTLGSVGFAAAISWVIPLTLPGLLAFFVVYYAESILGHSNIEVMPAALIRSPLGRIFSSTTFHAMHHSRMKGHYSLMTTTIDFLCGTVFPDYDDIYIRAVRGQGTNR